jgi:hypothetical protein
MSLNIQYIEFEDNYQINKCVISNEIINEISNNCKELIEFKLSDCKLINDIGIDSLASELLGLKKLNFSN